MSGQRLNWNIQEWKTFYRGCLPASSINKQPPSPITNRGGNVRIGLMRRFQRRNGNRSIMNIEWSVVQGKPISLLYISICSFSENLQAFCFYESSADHNDEWISHINFRFKVTCRFQCLYFRRWHHWFGQCLIEEKPLESRLLLFYCEEIILKTKLWFQYKIICAVNMLALVAQLYLRWIFMKPWKFLMHNHCQ